MTDPDLSRLAYWIKSIHSRIQKPIIFLVGTHLDAKEVTESLIEQVHLISIDIYLYIIYIYISVYGMFLCRWIDICICVI
jgi:hypothetical protein